MTFHHLRNVRGFFSDYYLGSVFGRGQGRGRKRHLSDRDTDLAYGRFRRIYNRAEGCGLDASDCREKFIRPFLRDVLEFHLGEGADRIHRLYASAEAATTGSPPLTVAYCGAWDENLDAGKGNAVPTRRLERELVGTNLSHGFLMAGERMRLVRAHGDGPRGAYLEVDLVGLAEDEDAESFAAFYRLYHVSQFVPGADGQAPIRLIEAESREHAEKVSEDLKRAVFTAAETLVGGLLADAVMREKVAELPALSDADLRLYRDAALTALYRILFILYAEARDPRLDAHTIYREAYSLHGLVEELLREPTRNWPENRSGLWARLKALFNIYDLGLPQITPWEHIPPRGGDFFNAETPEGRILEGASLPNRIVARLLLDLTTTAPRHGVGIERVSFRELDIESLGAVYEGLLEYEPRVARETTIELRVQGRTFALAPSEVLRLCEEKGLMVKGDYSIVAGTAAESLHPEAAIDEEDAGEEVLEDADVEPDEDTAEADEDEEAEGVAKGATATLVRRLGPGAFHFVPGPVRKGSGSFYTPLPLVQDLVRHALGPLTKEKSSSEIERLRVLDPACGSAHFLVEAMRFLGRELHRAYVEEFGKTGPPGFRSTTGLGWDDNWKASDEEARAANSEARAWCKRRIAERCLFGVDMNPTAVSLARVALWIESLAGDRPLTYFEHHVRCGNSLLGTWLDRLDHPPMPAMAKRSVSSQSDLFAGLVRKEVAEAAQTRRLIDEADPDALYREGIDPESVKEQDYKERQRKKAEETLAGARLLFDLRSTSAFMSEIWGEWQTLCGLVSDPHELAAYSASRPWWNAFEEIRQRERFFHWELEFPEVFLDTERPGFDAVLGNPPWDKVLPTKHEFYARYDVLIRAYKGNELERRIHELHEAKPGLKEAFAAYRSRTTTVAHLLRLSGDFPLSEARSQAAHEDVSKYLVDRAARLVANGGRVGMVVPSVLYNGDGCVGIRRFLLTNCAIERFYGFENRKKIFPIDSRYKFVSLVFRTGAPETDGFEAAFMRHDLAELKDDGPKPWMVRLTHQEIERLSPDTLAFLECRNPRDQEIIHKMHRNRPTLASEGIGSWGAALFTDFAHVLIYNGARDKDLWTDPESGRLFSPAHVLGSEPANVDETILRMREHGLWPVFEGKHIDQFLVGIKPVRWWLSVELAEQKHEKRPLDKATLVFRETASNTNERTAIAAVLPPCSAASHKLSGVLLKHVDAEAACAVLNSFCFDFALRLRTAGVNVSFTYIRPMPVPPADVVNSLPKIPTQLAWERGIEHITDDSNFWTMLWDSNREVAQAYGLIPDDLEHILHSFPVFARKRPEFYAYLQERLEEWKAEVSGKVKPIRPVYAAVAEPQAIPLAAEVAPAFKQRPPRKATGRDRYNQAAVLAYIVREFGRMDIGRVGHDKLLYFTQEHLGADLGLSFERKVAGPWDYVLKHKVEALAVKKGWLEIDKAGDPDSRSIFRPDRNVSEAVNQAKKKLGAKVQALRDLCEFFNDLGFGSSGLERWATIHKCWKDLVAQHGSVTEDALAAEVLAWKGNRPDYSEEAIRKAIRGMVKQELIKLRI